MPKWKEHQQFSDDTIVYINLCNITTIVLHKEIKEGGQRGKGILSIDYTNQQHYTRLYFNSREDALKWLKEATLKETNEVEKV